MLKNNSDKIIAHIEETMESWQEMGISLTEPASILFQFYCVNKEASEAFILFLKDRGYTVYNEQRRFLLLLKEYVIMVEMTQIWTREYVLETALHLADLADNYRTTYEGIFIGMGEE